MPPVGRLRPGQRTRRRQRRRSLRAGGPSGSVELKRLATVRGAARLAVPAPPPNSPRLTGDPVVPRCPRDFSRVRLARGDPVTDAPRPFPLLEARQAISIRRLRPTWRQRPPRTSERRPPRVDVPGHHCWRRPSQRPAPPAHEAPDPPGPLAPRWLQPDARSPAARRPLRWARRGLPGSPSNRARATDGGHTRAGALVLRSSPRVGTPQLTRRLSGRRESLQDARCRNRNGPALRSSTRLGAGCDAAAVTALHRRLRHSRAESSSSLRAGPLIRALSLHFVPLSGAQAPQPQEQRDGTRRPPGGLPAAITIASTSRRYWADPSEPVSPDGPCRPPDLGGRLYRRGVR